ncbi:hypothetical protein ACFQZW_06935 [Lutibacter aestuarii]|uniref:TonB C-terminal domain-containing protein n=1 Tax=Lutibacter aestuarii TaxID=861111 RepID=A0ABW2Z6M9_9FLAO|nr:hypothetical protein [uncultured Lutibacter sp.]
MKKFKLLTLALIIGTSSLFAANIEEDISKDKMRSEIVKLLEKPDFIVENEIYVNITFTFSSEGEVVVLNVDSKNQDVLNYIRKNLNYKKIENPGVRDKIYSMPITVKS